MDKKIEIRRYLIKTRIKRAFTARGISLIVTSLIGWLVTGDPLIGVSIGTLDLVIKLFLYYAHETVWERKITKDIKSIKTKHKN